LKELLRITFQKGNKLGKKFSRGHSFHYGNQWGEESQKKRSGSLHKTHMERHCKYFQQHPEQLLAVLFKNDTARQPRKVAWNKGLTKETDERVMKQSIATKIYMSQFKTLEDRLGIEKARETIAKIVSKNTGKKRSPESIKRYKKANAPKAWKGLRALGLKNQTRIEQFMQQALEKHGIVFIPENVVFVKGKARYRVDFELPNRKIFVECDGKRWHQDKEKDLLREQRILSQPEYSDYVFKRFTGSEIYQDLDGCIQKILGNNQEE